MIVEEEKEVKLLYEVEDLIVKGLEKGHNQNLFFTQNYTDFQSRIIEYLITVNIAQSLEEYCFSRGLGVNLEYPIKDFYNGAFPSVKFPTEIFGGEFQTRKDHNPVKNKSKRIDIAITSDPIHNNGYSSSGWRSLIGIEVKPLNPTKKKVEEDVLRLAKALALTDKISENQILSGYACFFRRFDKDNQTLNQTQIDNCKKEELSKWNKVFDSFSSDFPDLNFEIISKTLKESPVEKIEHELDPRFEDYQDYIDNSGLVVAYLIKVTHKK